MNQKLSIADLPVKDKTVLMRVDFNVPLDHQDRVADDTRISAALHSIKYILDKGGAVVLMSHLGRPKGKRKKELSLAPCAEKLSEMLGVPVSLAPDCIGEETEAMVRELKPGGVLLLENLRFHRAEEKPDEDPGFAKKLAQYGDFYVNDAFGTAHRRHASTFAVPSLFPGKAAAGFLMEKELEYLGGTLLNPSRPFCTIIGGAKISTKIGVLHSLLNKADKILIGGGMSYTFLKAKGFEIGDSVLEEDLIPEAKKILEESRELGVKIFLPIDHVVAERIAEDAPFQIVDVAEGIPQGEIGVDIGPRTIDAFDDQVRDAKTVFWNGPLGVFEVARFAEGTKEIARTVAGLEDAVTIVGGGDSASALQSVGYADRITHISTGGGAVLEYIEHGALPGIEALSEVAQQLPQG